MALTTPQQQRPGDVAVKTVVARVPQFAFWSRKKSKSLSAQELIKVDLICPKIQKSGH
jgi:hypothetical protein